MEILQMFIMTLHLALPGGTQFLTILQYFTCSCPLIRDNNIWLIFRVCLGGSSPPISCTGPMHNYALSAMETELNV